MILIHNIPIYWGVEEDPPDRAFLTGSWVIEDIIPFRVSTRGIRIRVSQRRLAARRSVPLPSRGSAHGPVLPALGHREVGSRMLRPKKKTRSRPPMPKNLARLEKLPTRDWSLLGDIPSQTAELFRGTVTSGDGQGVGPNGDGDPDDSGPGGDPSVTTAG